MFQQMFESMNELFDHIAARYEDASLKEKEQYKEQLYELKKVSDSVIDHWLHFEEKMADFQELQLQKDEGEASSKKAVALDEPLQAHGFSGKMVISNEAASMISKGQGYYKLFMFPQAAAHFQSAIHQSPECNLARLFLGMTYMHLQNWDEAQRHFQLLIELTDFPKWVAMSYNALGCIHAVRMNMVQAEQFFMKAYHICPSFKEALNNLKSCQETPQQLSLYFGSTELCCL